MWRSSMFGFEIFDSNSCLVYDSGPVSCSADSVNDLAFSTLDYFPAGVSCVIYVI